MTTRARWPFAGRLVRDMLYTDVDEPFTEDVSAAWLWTLNVRASEWELLDRSGPTQTGAGPYVELWRVHWWPWWGAEQSGWFTDAALALPLGAHAVNFYRAKSFSNVGEARLDYDVLARTVRHALRPLS